MDEAVDRFYEVLESAIKEYVPCSEIGQSKSDLPWFNEKCKQAINEKHAAENMENYLLVASRCQAVLTEEHNRYRTQLKRRLEQLPRGSKEWWKIASQLMHRRSKVSKVPPIKSEGNWLKDPTDKANAFAKTSNSKYQLPPDNLVPIFRVISTSFVRALCGKNWEDSGLIKLPDLMGSLPLCCAFLRPFSLFLSPFCAE